MADGIPARTVVGSIAEPDLQAEAGEVTTKEVAILKESATAFAKAAGSAGA